MIKNNTKNGNDLERFTLYLGESCVIEKEILSPYHKAMKETKCMSFVKAKITPKGELEYFFIGQYYDALELIKCFEKKPRFLKKVYFTVIDQYHTKNIIIEFEGDFIDALNFIVKNGKSFVARHHLIQLSSIDIIDFMKE